MRPSLMTIAATTMGMGGVDQRGALTMPPIFIQPGDSSLRRQRGMADNHRRVFGQAQCLAETFDASLAIAGRAVSLPQPVPYQFILDAGIALDIDKRIAIDPLSGPERRDRRRSPCPGLRMPKPSEQRLDLAEIGPAAPLSSNVCCNSTPCGTPPLPTSGEKLSWLPRI